MTTPHQEHERNAGGGPPSSPPGSAGGAPPSSSGTDKSARENSKHMGALGKTMRGVLKATTNQPKWWAKGMKAAGISMGLGGILKQSQVFTGTLGAIFQIFGAMVDVMLAPFIKPILIPAIKGLARLIPKMKEVGEWLLAGFQKIWPWLLAIMKFTLKIYANIASWVYRNIIKPFLDFVIPWGAKLAKKVGIEVESERARGSFDKSGKWDTDIASKAWMTSLVQRSRAITVPELGVPISKVKKVEEDKPLETYLFGVKTSTIVDTWEDIKNTTKDIFTQDGVHHVTLKKALETIKAGSKEGLQLPALGRDRSVDITSAAFHKLPEVQQHRRVREAFDPDNMRFQRDIDQQVEKANRRWDEGSYGRAARKLQVEFADGLIGSSWSGTGFWDE